MLPREVMLRRVKMIGAAVLLSTLCVNSRAFAFSVTLFQCLGDGNYQVGVTQASVILVHATYPRQTSRFSMPSAASQQISRPASLKHL